MNVALDGVALLICALTLLMTVIPAFVLIRQLIRNMRPSWYSSMVEVGRTLRTIGPGAPASRELRGTLREVRRMADIDRASYRGIGESLTAIMNNRGEECSHGALLDKLVDESRVQKEHRTTFTSEPKPPGKP